MPPIIGQALGAGFGSDKWTPQYQPGAKRLVKPLANFTKDTILKTQEGADAFAKDWAAGTDRQRSLQDEQSGIIRELLARRMGSDPNQLLGDIQDTLFSRINPDVVAPLAQFDVNDDRLRRMAAGINPAAVNSTADRLRSSRVASGRYYDVARQLSSLLPNLFTSAYNADVNNADIAAHYIPTLMSGYRDIDSSVLTPIRTRIGLTGGAGSAVQGTNEAIGSGIFGYQKKRNWADRLGDASEAAWQSTKDILNTAASLYGSFSGLGGMGGGGGGGGGIGGMLGGGGGSSGGSSGGTSAAPPQPRFISNPSTPRATSPQPAEFNPNLDWWQQPVY